MASTLATFSFVVGLYTMSLYEHCTTRVEALFGPGTQLWAGEGGAATDNSAAAATWMPATWMPAAWMPAAWMPAAWMPAAWMPAAWMPAAWMPAAWMPAGTPTAQAGAQHPQETHGNLVHRPGDLSPKWTVVQGEGDTGSASPPSASPLPASLLPASPLSGHARLLLL
jgi:hypothetical protein